MRNIFCKKNIIFGIFISFSVFTFINFSNCAPSAPSAAAVPTLDSFSPSHGTIGTLITIAGSELSNISTLTIGGGAAVIISKTSTMITALVMPAANTGLVTVTNSNSTTVASSSNFTVDANTVPTLQQGVKLVGSGATVNLPQTGSLQGASVATSADGNTIIVGGFADNSFTGAVWVYTRTAGVWSQQGAKLVGGGLTGVAGLGFSVALSADGSTALVGGNRDNNFEGGAWVFTRTAGVWTQQGLPLFGTGDVGNAQQGYAVALSADGNTAMVGGPQNNSGEGAVWVFTRSSGVWTQQGNKLLGATLFGLFAGQGASLALSADGNTALIGGPNDATDLGAAWVFTRSGGVWTQQGAKLVGTGYSGSAEQGTIVALSADGNTAVIGAYADNSYAGAAWVFTRSAGAWAQQGAKLVGTGVTIPPSYQGDVAISADGNTIALGGNADNNNTGAVWIFTRSAGVWSQSGTKLLGLAATNNSRLGGSLALSSDGKTLVAGGFTDNSNIGAVWVMVP